MSPPLPLPTTILSHLQLQKTTKLESTNLAHHNYHQLLAKEHTHATAIKSTTRQLHPPVRLGAACAGGWSQTPRYQTRRERCVVEFFSVEIRHIHLLETMITKWAMVMVVVMVVTADATRLARQASRCRSGQVCTPLRSCRTYQQFLTNPTAELWRRIRRASCSNERRNIQVCCSDVIGGTTGTTPTIPTDTTPTNTGSGESLLPSKCRRASRVARAATQLNIPLVVNGEDSNLKELPWTAILGYNSRTEPFWGCGGTLISEQYVVTAAHCVHQTHTQGATLEVVRLGEYDVSSVEDCFELTCAPAPQDFTPEQIILHPDFDTRTEVSDDIALIRLNKKATLNGYVDALCLPPAGAGVEGLLGGREAEVAGWGLTETGQRPTVLQKASLPFVNKGTCNPHYDNTLLPEQICFGGLAQDSCKGDSGGPLVRRGSNPLLIGIVSRGLDKRCGLIGIPAVYTHVAAYRNWITDNMRA
ncbi:hypothetical protein Pmani_021726 [Petrolisthes manimaculis]|uniref:Peptidase S1 domain-containing protein n=1 Tax=Petrolisthes manimaculis TaxID=1843537 RepID=A0AAE1PFN1_9EUCA|nr:hypothetical protein Pmani_021726 [Petrolisthes manimaculis]